MTYDYDTTATSNNDPWYFIRYNITAIKVYEGITEIGEGFFANCEQVKEVWLPQSLTKIGFQSFLNCECLKSVRIPDNVTLISGWAFSGCLNLTEIVLGNSLEVIRENAFNNCSSLVTVFVPESVTSIGGAAFSGCSSLTTVYLSNNLQMIADLTFYGCTSLNSIKIPEGVQEIGERVFYDCSSLTSITIPTSATSIGGSAFNGCTGLSSVTLGTRVESIGNSAFYICTNLTTITIPDSMSNISRAAFSGCTSLEKIIFKGNAPSFGNNAFGDVTATAYYPAYDKTWTEEVRQNYGGTITWVPYDGVIDVGGTEYMSFADALVACGEGQYLKLNSNTLANAVLSKDLYIDLNGFNLSGTIVTNGYKVYGMDSTTDSYTCDAIGYFNCVDENGKAIIPVTHFKSDITGSVKRYMAIKDGNGYSFHRFYLGITHLNLKPGTTGVGYKAVFYGDEMVAANLDSFGYTMTLGDCTPKTAMKAASSFVSGKTVTLRIDNYDVEKYGETDLTACVVLKLADGTVIESTAVTMTFRGLMEQLNANYTALTSEQLNAVAEMIKKYAIIISWDLKNLLAL